MKNYYKVNGIVIYNRPFKEKDKLVTLVTENGKFEAVAKGACSLKSHWVGRFEPLNELNLVLFNGPRQTTITQAYISNAHLRLREDLNLLTYGLTMAHLILDLTVVNSNDQKLYQLLTTALSTLEQSRNQELILAALTLKALKAAGIFPHIRSCLHCHKIMENMFFNVSAGGLVCQACLPIQERKHPVSQAALKLLQDLFKNKFANLNKIQYKEGDLKYTTELIWEHLNYHLPANMRVQTFLKDVSKN